MSIVMRDYHGHEELLTDPAEAGARFDEQASAIMPHGTCGQVIWFGPTDAPAQIRVDIDIDADRAAMRWLEDGSYAAELDPVGPISVMASADGELATITADLARVRPDTVRHAVIEYVTTGQRPAATRWQPTIDG
jgi:hypothetical protein